MYLNKHARSRVPDNYFKHTHFHSNHVTKGALKDCLLKLVLTRVSQPSWQQKQKIYPK